MYIKDFGREVLKNTHHNSAASIINQEAVVKFL